MMKRWMFSLLLGCLLLCGCAGSDSGGSIQQIGVKDAVGKLEAKHTFVLLVTRTQCSYCKALVEHLQDTIDEHAIVIYDVVMDDSTVDTLQADIDTLSAYLERPDQTPHYYFIKDGEVQDEEKGYTSANPDRFWDWIGRNGLETEG